MPGCVLRASGQQFEPQRFLDDSPFVPCNVFRKGERKAHNHSWTTSGFTVVVSEASGDDLPRQVQDAYEFLGVHSILWPDEFTVYDVRVCGELPGFDNLDNLGSFDKKWARYCEYRNAVRAAVPQKESLRDKDRCLWAQSAIRQLNEDIEAGFTRRADG